MLTKTQTKILQVFVSQITKRFSINQISKIISKPYPLVHRSMKGLLDNGFLIKDKQNYISLNYKANNLELSYIESLNKQEFLEKKKVISSFTEDVFKEIKEDFFILLVFGSVIKSKKPRDIDILMILPDARKIDEIEGYLRNIASSFHTIFDINVISAESVKEMLNNRDEMNVMNETFNNHIILFGAENFYRILKDAR